MKRTKRTWTNRDGQQQSAYTVRWWENGRQRRQTFQMGHDVATLAKHYAGVLRDLEDGPRVSATDAILNARHANTQEQANAR